MSCYRWRDWKHEESDQVSIWLETCSGHAQKANSKGFPWCLYLLEYMHRNCWRSLLCMRFITIARKWESQVNTKHGFEYLSSQECAWLSAPHRPWLGSKFSQRNGSSIHQQARAEIPRQKEEGSTAVFKFIWMWPSIRFDGQSTRQCIWLTHYCQRQKSYWNDCITNKQRHFRSNQQVWITRIQTAPKPTIGMSLFGCFPYGCWCNWGGKD